MNEQRHRVTSQWLPLGAVIAAVNETHANTLLIADDGHDRITLFSPAGEFLGKVAVESRRPQVNRMTS